VTGSYRGGSSELLSYDRGNPAVCFYRSLSLIPILLDELTPTPRLVVPFVSVGEERLYTEIPAHFFGDTVDYFLMVESPDVENAWVSSFQSSTRIAAESEMKDLIRFSLSGLPCQLSPSRPAGAPIRERAFFFKLNNLSKVWRTIESDRDIAIEWKDMPEGIAIELVAVQK
jgi:predicted component of type VI protein secretion system